MTTPASRSDGDPGDIAVLVVDDHPLVRQGLRAILDAAPGVRVVGEAADGDEVVDAARACAPRVVLMDASMPRLDGVRATRALREAVPGAAVVMLTSFSGRERVRAAIEAGVTGYVLKDADPAQVVAAVRAAAGGHVPLDPRVAGALLPAPAGAAPAPEAASAPGDPSIRGGQSVPRRPGPAAAPDPSPEAAADLSAREREVLALVAQGLANKQIARRLGISERTVKAHLGAVYRAIGVADRTSAALWANRHGLG